MNKDRYSRLAKATSRRILVLDGAMGSLIQAEGLGEEDFRGTRFRNHHTELSGNNDILCLSRPDIIRKIHEAYLEAGADIITTNTFNSTSITQKDYGLEKLVGEINYEAASIARQAADRQSEKNPDRPRFVAGSIPPTSRSASLAPDPGKSNLNISFDELAVAYMEQVRALIEGGADILLIETVFDTLNAKAAIHAVSTILKEKNIFLPLWISATVADLSGRILSGQTIDAFRISVRHSKPFAIGLNCALGTGHLKPFIAELAQSCESLVSVHPNAGLPDESGKYHESPARMASDLQNLAEQGLLNIAGGCCGTTPLHIRAISESLEGIAPRRPPEKSSSAFFSGLEPLCIDPDSLLVTAGERTNVTGSRKFARLVREENYESALDVARRQVLGGARIIDVNMDDPLLDSVNAMKSFLLVCGADPDVAKVPVMIDSSSFEVIEAGLKCVQGRCIVNSISLKEGEEEFLRRAEIIRQYGAAAVLMCCDERGQATTVERRIETALRAYTVLMDSGNWQPEDIIIDPNIFALGSGLEEEDRSALDFIDSLSLIKEKLPGCLTIGGISNAGYGFRGNNTVREAIHAVFLYHAVRAGLDIAIVNAGNLPPYETIETDLKEAVEDLVLARRPDAAKRLADKAQKISPISRNKSQIQEWRNLPPSSRLLHAMIHGDEEFLEQDTLECLNESFDPLKVVEGPLMNAMSRVGELFGEGKIFLPQVIRAARIMKKAVSYLQPAIKASESKQVMGEKDGEKLSEKQITKSCSEAENKILMATVRGDIHDIGKNIASVILSCNRFEIVDLGVMIPAWQIAEKARDEKVRAVGLSGLITPSLSEMEKTASEMQKLNLRIPLLIGGAATSALHTALKIDPLYEGPVVHVRDASLAPGILSGILGEGGEDRISQIKKDCMEMRIRHRHRSEKQLFLPLEKARQHGIKTNWNSYRPPKPLSLMPLLFNNLDLSVLRPLINWNSFFRTWGIKASSLDGKKHSLEEPNRFLADNPETQRLFSDASDMLDLMQEDSSLIVHAIARIFPANSSGDDILLYADESRKTADAVFHFTRRQILKGVKRPAAPETSSSIPKSPEKLYSASSKELIDDRDHNPFFFTESQSTEKLFPCLSDLVAPVSSGMPDWAGCFAVSTRAAESKESGKHNTKSEDEYQSLMIKSLADSLTEAAALWLHNHICTKIWLPESRDADAPKLADKGRGCIRPAPGYPSCPDHTEKKTILDLLEAEKNIGVTLTENFMMAPSSSTCGWYFNHPEASYFAVGPIEEDQLKDYASRKGWSEKTAKKWLLSNLYYKD